MILKGDHRPGWVDAGKAKAARRANAGLQQQPTTHHAAPGADVYVAHGGAPRSTRTLSRADKKALIEAHASNSLKVAQKQAVVIGAGPGGLAAAITLTQMGMKVTVLEARANQSGDMPAHARPHQISLRQDSLDTLKTLGAYDDVIGASGFLRQEHHIKTNGTEHSLRVSKPKPERTPEVLSLINPNTLKTDSVSQVRISDIEKALLKQALQMGIEIKAGVSAELSRSSEGSSYDVGIRKVAKDGVGYKPYGESTALGPQDLVVVADGAGSPTRTALGIEVLEQSPLKNYLGGHIQKGIDAVTRKATVTEKDGLKRHVMGTGHAKYDQTWVSVEITPEEAKLGPKERAQLLADKAQYVMLEKVTPEDIGWGAGQLTTVQNRRARVATAGDNVVLLGDAAGTGSVWVGGGLNLALTTHLSALKNLALRMNEGCERDSALKIYDRSIQWATTVWHKAGAAELGVAG